MKTLLNTFLSATLMLKAVLQVRFQHCFASGGAGVDPSNPHSYCGIKQNHKLVVGLLGVSLIMPQVFGGAVLTPLMSFNGTNGSVPEATLLLGTDGMMYGTTIYGATNHVASGGDGIVFRVSTNGTSETVTILDRTYAAAPQAGLIQGSDGNFYGTTGFGGERDWGVAFKITPEGMFSTFASLNWPVAEYANGLVEGADHFLYGTAYYGGTNGGYGSVFKISTNGIATLLAGFNETNGAHPQAALMRGADGNFYGTTVNGGTNGGWGTVFRITPAGELTSLVSFTGTNGAHPMSALIQTADGIIYGTTSGGGIGFQNTLYTGNGTVFKITPRGRLITLHFFTGYPDDGSLPSFGGLSLGPDGNYYGTTERGGANASGTIYSITTNGSVRLLYSFSRQDYATGTNSDGCSPSAGLVLAGDGNFYGVAMEGGEYGLGTIFRFTVTPDPLVLKTPILLDGRLTLAWDAVEGQNYQVQRSASLKPADWQDMGSAIVATNSVATTSDAVGSEGQSYYRVVELK